MQFWRSLSALVFDELFGARADLAFTGIEWGRLPAALVPGLIFALRTADLTLATLRTLTVIRGHRATAWFLGFGQALLFVTAVAGVLRNLHNPWNIVAYAVGFATGNVLGITIEAKLAPGHSLLRIVSARRGAAIAEALRRKGRGATEVPAHGKLGTVSVIFCYVPRRDVERVRRQIVSADPDAFLTVEHVRQLRGGWRA
jgi:uncharacterized protein YebE (UPF0316 family)